MATEYVWIGRSCIAGAVAIDVGANVGQVSALMANRVGKSGLVLAFEPNPECFHELSIGSRAPTLAFNLALGGVSGEVELHVPLDEQGRTQAQLGSLVVGAAGATVKYETHHVAMVTLDSMVARFQQPVCVIKIDVEGFEYDVLLGARQAIEIHRPTLVIEIEQRHQRPPHSVHRTLELLTYVGYSVFGIGENRLVPTDEFDFGSQQVLDEATGLPGTPYINNFLCIPKGNSLQSSLVEPYL